MSLSREELLKPATSFPGTIIGYDAHIYFENNPESKASAESLREKIIATFGNDLAESKEKNDKLPRGIRVYNLVPYPIGPHPIPMFECDFESPQVFAKLVPWLQLNHGNHPVLVHPRSGHPLEDHTINAIWIGDKVTLNEAPLRKHA